MNAIEATGLWHTYPGGKDAVKDVSFTVKDGEFFGFLGPNGAGKTTTIKMLVTLLKPTQGRVVVNGIDAATDPVAVRATVGYNAQDTSVDGELTAIENLRFACESYRVPRNERASRCADLLRLVELEGEAKKLARTFSGGMRKRLDIATALVHRPRLLFLDEPTTGLDPKARLNLWAYFRELNRQGTTLFLTTQYLEEADQLCSRIAVIADGRIVAMGTPAELKAQVGGDALEVHFENATREDAERAKTLIEESGLVKAGDEHIGALATGIVVTSPRAKRIGSDVLLELKKGGFVVTQFNLRSPTLDEVFLKFTGGTLEEAEERAKAAAETGAPRGRAGGRGR
ncbi:MAG: ABC transporter ATP-binding protein [Thermoplasmatota archaeon]